MSHADRILRIFGYLRTAQRCYAVHRTQNHYEVLGVPTTASKKDIRAAYLELSKQNHPDTSSKKDHSDFLKITEAYNVLSKDSSRQEYDETLKYARGRRHSTYHNPYGQTYSRAYQYRAGNSYSDSNFDEWRYNIYRMNHRYGVPNWDERKTSQNAQPRISNTTILLVCLLVSVFGVGLQILAVVASPMFNREKLLKQSAEYVEIHRKIRENVELNLTRADSIHAFQQRVGAHPSDEITDVADTVEV